MIGRALVITLALAVPVGAQEMDFSPDATQSCLYRSYNSVTCIGVSAQSCIATPEGSSGAGRGRCYALERAYWDTRLARAYEHLVEGGRRLDQVLPAESPIPRQVPALEALRGQFVAYRDAFCVFEEATWAGGLESRAAVEQCLMTLTGLQVLMLERGFEVH